MSQIIKSSTPGLHWSIYTHKSPGRPAHAMATEGTLDDTPGNAFIGFSYVYGEARQMREDIPGRMTTKSKNVALNALFTKMKDAGMIAEGEAITPEV